MLAVRERFKEKAAVFLRHKNFTNNRGGPDQIIEILFTLLCLAVIKFKLLVGGKSSTDVAILLVDVCGSSSRKNLIGIP